MLTRERDGIVIPSMSCSIIGCGSLASLFAMNAARSGIDDFNGIRVYIWTELLMLGGHALILNGNQYKLSEFFDSDGLYKDGILVNPWEYTKKDHGCQTTYVSYSGLTVSSFVS